MTSSVQKENHTMKHGHQRSRALGFTLIEVMIVVGVIGILSAIAFPSYNQYVQRTHRANARAALLQTAQWLERAATAQGSYPAAAAIPAGVLQVEGGRYTITLPVLTAGTFTLRATPNVAAQSTDQCGAFQMTHAGVRTQVATTAVPTPLTAQECWNR
jgi:type IV pilus assembly protein PilE